MARLRIWFRRHVRSLLRTTNDKPSPRGGRRKSTPAVALKDIPISAPILVSNDGVNFKIPATKPRPRPQSLPVLNFNGPDLSETLRHSSNEFTILDLKDISIEDELHSLSSPSTVAEEQEDLDFDMEAAPSLCSDSDNEDVMPEYLWPATPTSPARYSRRPSLFQVIGAGPHTPQVQVMSSRPHSYMDAATFSNLGAGDGNNRLSRYSVMSRESERRSRHTSWLSRSSSRKDKRASMLSQGSATNNKRASFMSISDAEMDGLSPSSLGDWEDASASASRRLSRRMSWGFETYATAYTPARILL